MDSADTRPVQAPEEGKVVAVPQVGGPVDVGSCPRRTEISGAEPEASALPQYETPLNIR